jgi:hypothetical protein
MITVRDVADPSAISSSPPDVSSRKQDRRPYDGPLLDGDSDRCRGERDAGISRCHYSELYAGQEFGGPDVDRYPDLEQLVAGLQAENASLQAQVAELGVAAADRDRQLSDLAARLDRLDHGGMDNGAVAREKNHGSF